jgi:hypothetical protein
MLHYFQNCVCLLQHPPLHKDGYKDEQVTKARPKIIPFNKIKQKLWKLVQQKTPQFAGLFLWKRG